MVNVIMTDKINLEHIGRVVDFISGENTISLTQKEKDDFVSCYANMKEQEGRITQILTAKIA